MLTYWAERRPDEPALRYRGQTITHSGLAVKVKARAEELRASCDTCTAILAESSPECVIELFAANIAGLQVVMLDPSLSDDLLKKLLPYADCDRLWTSDEELAEELTPCLGQGVTEGRDRILFFTSGTTSRSKAVVLTGKSLCASAWNGAEMLPLDPADTLLSILPLAHVFGFVCGLMWGLSCGSCVALGTGPRGYLTDFGAYRPTAVSVVPLLLDFLLKNGALNPELRTLLIGAGDCPPELIDAARALGLSVSFGYGLTETSSGVAISTSGDPFAMDICPDDRIEIAKDGEVMITAPTCVMQGYYKDPDSTEAALSGGVLASGDLGFIDEEGRLHITGRKKDILVLPDGTKIFIPEYEASVSRALAGESGVLPVPEFAVGLRGGKPVLIVCGAGGQNAKDVIYSKLKPFSETLPRGQQITDVLFTKGPFPRTATGKLKRW